MKFISIIIPCHNRLPMLEALIQSIPSIEDLEVIVVDDHSTEDLSQISLEKFKHHKFVKNKRELRYAGTARNTGLEQASGEYVFFADSDDLIVADGFLKCLEMLQDRKPDILFANSTSFKDTDGSPGSRHIRNNWLVNSVLKGESVEILARIGGPIAKFIRRDFLSQHAIRFEPQRYSNDIVFSAFLMIHKPIIQVTNEVVYSIREGNNSLTNNFSLESALIRLEALNCYNTVLKENGMGYLMVPALPLLSRIYRKDRRQAIFHAWGAKTRGHPVFFTWWTYKNILLRWMRGV
jgi:glycosyltransferase involved in cell wall biosynthesis